MSEQNEVRGQIAKIIEDYEGDMPLDNKKFKLVKTKRTNKAVTDILSIPEIQEALDKSDNKLEAIKLLENEIHKIRPLSDCYQKICKELGIEKDVLGYIRKVLQEAQKALGRKMMGEEEIANTIRSYAFMHECSSGNEGIILEKEVCNIAHALAGKIPAQEQPKKEEAKQEYCKCEYPDLTTFGTKCKQCGHRVIYKSELDPKPASEGIEELGFFEPEHETLYKKVDEAIRHINALEDRIRELENK